MAWLPRQFQNGGLLSHFFQDEFLLDSQPLDAETLVSGKAECLPVLAIGDHKKGKLLGVTLPSLHL